MANMRLPGPLGFCTNLPRIDFGTTARTSTPAPGTIGTTTPGTTTPPAETSTPSIEFKFDIEKAVAHLDKNAHATSQGYCAKYVRQAIEAGGVKIPLPRPIYAKDYGLALAGLGFKKTDATDYAPTKGDIVVIQPPKGQTAGHIQMHNGKNWVSDFIQGEGIYPGPAYRKEKVSYEIYRP